MPMREIKFRAWCKSLQKMYTVRTMRMEEDGVCLLYLVPVDDEDGRGLTVDNLADIELMPFTGLRDTSGRDIYEGDILLLTLGKHRLEVRWSLLGWRFFNLATQDWQFVYAADIKRLEVLGNRYEQPELLSMEEVA